MATFMATVASNSPRLKVPDAARKVLERYIWDGDTTAVIRDDEEDGEPRLLVYGYDWPAAWKVPEGVKRDQFEPDYDIDTGFEEFLRDVAPFLAEPLTIQAIGSEKCRFPISACEWHIVPGATQIEIAGFNHSFAEPAEDQPTNL